MVCIKHILAAESGKYSCVRSSTQNVAARNYSDERAQEVYDCFVRESDIKVTTSGIYERYVVDTAPVVKSIR